MTQVLCVRKDQLPIDFKTEAFGISTPFNFDKPQYEMLDRPACEKMFDYVQLIPYITLFDENNNIFAYARGDAGGEAGLHGRCSIGLGGHIEEEVTADRSVMDVVVNAINRELEEEVGLPITEERTKLFYEKLQNQNFMILVDNTNDVGRVHLGIALFLKVSPEELGAHEEGVITKGQWIKPADLGKMDATQVVELENWSKTVLNAVIAADSGYAVAS